MTRPVQSLRNLLQSRPIDWDTVHTLVSLNSEHVGSPLQSFYVKSQLQRCLEIDESPPPERVVRALLRANPGAAFSVDEDGRTCVHYACKHRCSLDVISLLLSANPDAAGRQSRNGEIPLHVAYDEPAARLLLELYPAGVGIRSNKGELPLHAAAVQGTPDLVGMLIEHGQKTSPSLSVCGGGALANDKLQCSPLDRICDVIFSMTKTTASEGKGNSDVTHKIPSEIDGELSAAWQKLQIIARAAYFAASASSSSTDEPFLLLHALIDLGCLSEVIVCAARRHPEQVIQGDHLGRVPVSIAASSTGENSNQTAKERQEIVHALLYSTSYGCLTAATTKNNNKSLPLNYALQHGGKWDGGVRDLFLADPRVAEMSDHYSGGLLSFMLASVESDKGGGDTNTIYCLLRECPSVLQAYI